ncbi:MAG: hypothetical protein HYR94_12955 [Chloroflexi bacterium]|nr:hypothetical protein [Chloroflexota bacterium]
MANPRASEDMRKQRNEKPGKEIIPHASRLTLHASRLPLHASRFTLHLSAYAWLYCLSAIILLYAALSFYQIDLPGLHYDEAFEAVLL